MYPSYWRYKTYPTSSLSLDARSLRIDEKSRMHCILQTQGRWWQRDRSSRLEPLNDDVCRKSDSAFVQSASYAVDIVHHPTQMIFLA